MQILFHNFNIQMIKSSFIKNLKVFKNVKLFLICNFEIPEFFEEFLRK